MKKLVEKDLLSAEEAELPDLGEIPEADPLPDDDEEDEDEDEEDEEDSDDERRKKKPGPKPGSKRTGHKLEPDARKKRGRPPRVDTPMDSGTARCSPLRQRMAISRSSRIAANSARQSSSLGEAMTSSLGTALS